MRRARSLSLILRGGDFRVIYLTMPVGSTFGWGVCGKNIARELACRTPVQLFAPNFTVEDIGNELEFFELRRLLPPPHLARLPVTPGSPPLDGSLLQAINGNDLLPINTNIKGTPTVGYTFFEDNILPPQSLENARRHFRHIATGSSWCTCILKDLGLTDSSTVLQGIDPAIFHPSAQPRSFLQNFFVVFSGGKFEFRKSQDVVIRAYKVLQDRHPDVMLVNAWYNPWPGSRATMARSPHIRYISSTQEHVPWVQTILAANGIDLARVLTLGPRDHHLLPRIYHNTDVGIFPNRCEGGTNLVLMEYMACGKPVIATASTGHADIVSHANALIISSDKTRPIFDAQDNPIASWPEPDLDEAIAQLEYAYQNRDHLQPLAAQAAADMVRLTWGRTAEQFLQLLQQFRGAA